MTDTNTPVVQPTVNQPLQGGNTPVYNVAQPHPITPQQSQWVGNLMQMAITSYVGKQMMKRNPYLPGILMAVQRGVTTMGQTQAGIDVDMQNAALIHQFQAQALQPQPVQQIAAPEPSTDLADIKQLIADQAVRHNELVDRLKNVKGFK